MIVAGNIMTLSYIGGTTVGSVFAYVLAVIIHYEYYWIAAQHAFGLIDRNRAPLKLENRTIEIFLNQMLTLNATNIVRTPV